MSLSARASANGIQPDSMHPVYLAANRLPGFFPDMPDDAKRDALRKSPLVDYPEVTAARIASEQPKGAA